jgi:hypothetical protein
MSEAYVIKVAMLVTAETSPKALSEALDLAFEDDDRILKFVVEHWGWAPSAEPALAV